MALLFTLTYLWGGQNFLQLLTNDTEVIAASGTYLLWTVAIPFCGFSAFILDGICIGTTSTRIMLKSMATASALFFGVYFLCSGSWGNHALWMAFLVYLAVRGLMQGYLLRNKI